MTIACRQCGSQFAPSERGRPPKYCCLKCKDKATKFKNREKVRARQRAYHKLYYARNREKILSKNKKWIENHPDKPRAYTAAWRKRNPEQERIRLREYLLNNREKVLAQKRQRHKINAEKDREYRNSHKEEGNRRSREWQAKYREQNREEYKRKCREWRRLYPETYRAKYHRRRSNVTGSGGSYTPEEWAALLVDCGYRCLCCGKTGVKLTVDHIIPVSLGGSSNIDNIQPLCLPCNARKQDRIINFRIALCQ